MRRVPEPELMDGADQALAYARADFEEPNRRFIELAAARLAGLPLGAAVLDLGCGPGDITLRLARANPTWRVHGVDGAPRMLRYAEEALAATPTLRARVRFVLGRVPGAAAPLERYDGIVSNSLLHHLHDPAGLWREVRERAAPGARALIMDLRRPESPEAAQALVDAYSDGEPEVLRRDFYASLRAAFTPDEVRAQLAVAGLPLRVEVISDRHLLISGALPG